VKVLEWMPSGKELIPFQIRLAVADMTGKLSNLTAPVLTAREEESFGSSLGWLSLQLQLFSVHVNRK